MQTGIDNNYDTDIGSQERSVVAATKLWVIVFSVLALFGVFLVWMLLSGTSGVPSGPSSTVNTASRPAEP